MISAQRDPRISVWGLRGAAERTATPTAQLLETPHTIHSSTKQRCSLFHLRAITQSTSITSATFSFGTTAGINVPGVPSAIPLPGALPLFATGVVGLGLLGWRKKRKAQAAAA